VGALPASSISNANNDESRPDATAPAFQVGQSLRPSGSMETNAAKTNDLALKGGRTLRQAGLPYLVEEDVCVCPAGEGLTYSFTTKENGLVLRCYSINACQSCAIKHSCTTGKERRISRWEHEHILEAVQRRLDEHPEKMRQRRETVEHPFSTIKARGATQFLMKTLPWVTAEMALHVLAYNMTRVMNTMGTKPLVAADLRPS
jgi:hypothetical protein